MGLLTAVMVTTATSAGVNTWIAVDALSDDQGVVMSQGEFMTCPWPGMPCHRR